MMKRFSVFSFMAQTCCAFGLLASCSSSDAVSDGTMTDGGKTFSIHASVPASRTTFDYNSTDKKVDVLWKAGDKISVVNASSASAATFLSASGGSTSTTFSGKLALNSGNNLLYAIYPPVTASGSSASFDCSQQTEDEALMFGSASVDGSATSADMSFSNAMTLLRITLTLPAGAGTITSLTLSGTGLVSGGTFDAATKTWSQTTEGDIRVNGSWTPSDNKITVYVHLLPQTLPALYIIASDGTKAYLATTSSTPTIELGKEYPINKTANEVSLMNVTVGARTFTAVLDNNVVTTKLKTLLPLTLDMTELNGNEKYKYVTETFDNSGSANPGTIHSGDIKLYSNNCLVLFYQTFSTAYSYTSIAHITDETGLAEALGTGSVTVTFALKSMGTGSLTATAVGTDWSGTLGGNFSGITRIGDNQYAVVDDKSVTDGYYPFTIDIDKSTGNITSVMKKGTLVTNGGSNRDSEGIVYVPSTKTFFISGEQDKSIKEYKTDGTLTGRTMNMPAIFSGASGNYNLESLGYNANTHLFWTTTESTIPGDGEQATATNGVQNKLRIQCFNEQLQPVRQYAYLMDKPTSTTDASTYAMGVSDILALDDGRLVVLEREFYVPSSYLSSFVNCKLYLVSPSAGTPITSSDALNSSSPYLSKTLLTSFQTSIANIANYEGMCLGPKLDDGSQTIILVSDSQANYGGGALKDWFKVIKIK